MESAKSLERFDFREITLSDRTRIQPFLNEWNFQSCELSFVNLYIWGQNQTIQYMIDEDYLFLLFERPRYGPFLFPPVPRSKSMTMDRALAIAKAYFLSRGKPMEIRCATAPLMELFKRVEGLEFEPDRSNFDYVYHSRDLIELAGKKYHGKRNHINNFLAQHTYAYQRIDRSAVDECMQVYESWLNTKDVTEPGILGEQRAIKAAFSQMENLGLLGGCIRVEGKIQAFSLAERLENADTAIIHIEKANSDIQGLYPLINQCFAREELSDLTYINREEDMGLEGLRRSKLSYHPAQLIEKYSVRMRSGI